MGSGTSGSITVGRLAEAGFDVLVIEAGGYTNYILSEVKHPSTESPPTVIGIDFFRRAYSTGTKRAATSEPSGLRLSLEEIE